MVEYRATKEWPYHIGCGGAVYREIDGVRTYALLYRGERFGPRGNTWHLPKGTLSSDETLEECARREIKEETGFEVEIEKYLGAVHDRWINQQHDILTDKTVHHFLCRYISGSSTAMDQEHDEVQWVEPLLAIERLAKMPKQEEEIIKRAEQYLSCHS